MQRDEVLGIIDKAFAARISGDTEALAGIWAEGATFDMAGDAALLESLPGSGGPTLSRPAVEQLIGFIAISAVERLHAVVEGLTAATLSRVTVAFGTRAPFETLFFDLWELTEDRRIRSLRQFVDTAKAAAEMRAYVAMGGASPAEEPGTPY